CRPFRTQRRRESRLQQQYPGQTSNVLKIPIMQDGTGRYNRAEMPPPNIVICLACQPPFSLQLEALRENLAFDRKFQFAIFLNKRHRFASVSPVKLECSPLVGDAAIILYKDAIARWRRGSRTRHRACVVERRTLARTLLFREQRHQA